MLHGLRSTSRAACRAFRYSAIGFLVTWGAGYWLTTQLSLLEPWILGALVLSFVSQAFVVYSLSRERPSLAIFVPLFVVLVLMVFRPTWSLLRT